MDTSDPIERSDASLPAEENDNVSEFSDFFVLTPSAHSKSEDDHLMPLSEHSGEKAGNNVTSAAVEALLAVGEESEKKPHVDDIDATADIGVVNDKPIALDSAEQPVDSQPAIATDNGPGSKTTGMVVIFAKGVSSAQAQTAIYAVANLDILHEFDFGGVSILPINVGEQVRITTPVNGAPLPADGTHGDEVIMDTVYRSSTNKTPQSSAQPCKKSPVVAENSSLLFHRTEILKARTLRLLMNAKGMFDSCGCPELDSGGNLKRESTNSHCVAAGSGDQAPSLSTLIDLAKARIHRKLSIPKNIDAFDFLGFDFPSSPPGPPPVEKGKSKKTTKKSGTAAASKKLANDKHVYKVIAVVQLFALLFLVLCIVGKTAESKGRCVGVWTGA